MKVWFDLLYKAGGKKYFDTIGAEADFDWLGTNPFDEIKKYDIYYWGITRDFRPLKAELCRSPAKFPVPNRALEPRLKIIESNDYKRLGDDNKSRIDGNASFWRAEPITMNNNTYYPVGDIMLASDWRDLAYASGSYEPYYNAWWGGDIGKRIVGDLSNGINSGNSSRVNRAGPNMRTILVAGDVKSPTSTVLNAQYGGRNRLSLHSLTCPDGYTDLGDVTGSTINSYNPIGDGTIKCIPNDCVEQVKDVPILKPWSGSESYDASTNVVKYNQVLNTPFSGDLSANDKNGYNLFRGHSGRQFKRIKDSCLTIPNNGDAPIKQIEPNSNELGIGWYGHPYKLDPKYSIFTFMGIVPEGLIVHQGTGRRFYIIYCGKEDPNIFNVLDYNENKKSYINALQVDSVSTNARVTSRPVNNGEAMQQWNIKLQPDKKKLKLKNVFNNNYLYLGLDPLQGKSQFSTIGDYPVGGFADGSPWGAPADSNLAKKAKENSTEYRGLTEEQ